MPIDQVGQVAATRVAINFSHETDTGFDVTLNPMSQASPEEIDEALQDLVDLLAGWSKLSGNVNAQRYTDTQHEVTATP